MTTVTHPAFADLLPADVSAAVRRTRALAASLNERTSQPAPVNPKTLGDR